MRFALPHMLWLLLLVPIIGAGLVWASGYRRSLLERFGADKALVKHGVAAIGAVTWVRMGLFLFSLVLLVCGLARPQWGYHERQVITHGVDMVVAIDTSDSMMARDFQPNRLARATELLRSLIWEAQGDRIGIVAFSGSAVVLCPLTLDYKMAATALKAVDNNTVSAEGTNIAAAINAARGAFEVSGSNDRVLVLLTDGEQLDRPEELDKAVTDAVESGIKIFAIGLGSEDGSTIPTMGGPKRSSTGDIVQTRLNFEKLEEIASKTDGEAFRAGQAGAGEIADISAALSKYRGRKQQDKTYRVYQERYPWFVGAAMVLLLADSLLGGVHYLRRRRRSSIVTGIGVIGVTLGLGQDVTAAYPGESYIRSRDALQRYHAGEFEQSAELYEKAAEVSPQNNQIQFNLGAAAAKAGKLAEAKESFGKVFDPQNPTLNAYARYGMATLDHRELRKEISTKKEEWASAAAEGAAPKEEIQQAVAQLKDIIEEYKQSILAKPDDVDMKANYELAKKDLQELEDLLKENQEQQEQQQEQQQENQEEKEDQQQQGEQQEQENGQQQQGQQGQEDQEQGEQKQDQPESEKPKPEGQQGEQQDQQQKPDGNQQDQQQGEQQQGESEGETPVEKENQEQQQDPAGTPAPTPSPTPQGTPQPGENQGAGQEPSEQGQPVPVGQMSPTDVDRLLNTLPPEDQKALQLMMGAPTEEQDLEHDW